MTFCRKIVIFGLVQHKKTRRTMCRSGKGIQLNCGAQIQR